MTKRKASEVAGAVQSTAQAAKRQAVGAAGKRVVGMSGGGDEGEEDVAAEADQLPAAMDVGTPQGAQDTLAITTVQHMPTVQ